MKSKKLNGKANIIGKNIQKNRLQCDLSLRQLSDKLSLYGITLYHSDIFDIENYNRLVKDFELKAICKVLKITYEQVFKDTDKDYLA